MSKMGSKMIRDADSRALDNAGRIFLAMAELARLEVENGKLRAEVARLEAEKAGLLDIARLVLQIFESMPAPKLGNWNWPHLADWVREAIARATS